MTNVVVIGRNPNSILGMIRAAGEVGCTVSVIKTVKKMPKRISYERFSPPSRSKYVTNYEFALEPDAEGLVELLKSKFVKNGCKVVILPTDDYAAEVIDTYQDELRDYFVFPNICNTAGAIVQLMDKNDQKKLAIQAGLPVAKGWSIQLSAGKYHLPNDICFPCFVKPETAILNRKRYMAKCNNVKELKDILSFAAQQQDCFMLVEEYKSIERESCIVGFSNGQNVVAPAKIDTIRFGYGSHKGVTAIGKVTSRLQNEELFKKAEKLVCSMNFIGLFDIDLYECEGIVFFNELNVRQGASGYAITRAGVNLPAMLINTLVNKHYCLPESTFDIRELTFANDLVCLDDFGSGYISRKELKKMLHDVDVRFLQDENDKGPQRAFIISFLKQLVKRIIK